MASNGYKFLKIASLVVIVFAIICAAAFRSAPPKKPVLKIAEAQQTLGEAFEGQHIQHRFAIVNQSDQDVQDIELSASCSCTSIEPLKSAEDDTWHEFEISVTVSEPGNVTYRPALQVVPMNDVNPPVKLPLPIQAYGLDRNLAQRTPEISPK